MDGLKLFLLLIVLVLKCDLIPLPCSNNCLQTSEYACEALPCTDGCKPGWHGNDCTIPCNQSCKNMICNQEDGACTKEHLSEPISLRLSENCLETDSQNINKCRCCASMYRGDNCETKCDRCITKNDDGCLYMCTTGYYGTTCNQTCPESCEKGINGRPVCKEEDGVVKCSNGCPLRKFGELCDQSCSELCKNACLQSSGYCEDCIDGSYGHRCDKPCDCDDRKCFRNGSCVEKCVDDINCTWSCPKNCKQSINFDCGNSNGTKKCIHGCIDGFYGQTCEHACEKTCPSCNQNSGECVFLHETSATGSSNVIIGVAVACVVGLIIAITVIVVCRRRIRQTISGCRLYRICNRRESVETAEENRSQTQYRYVPQQEGDYVNNPLRRDENQAALINRSAEGGHDVNSSDRDENQAALINRSAEGGHDVNSSDRESVRKIVKKFEKMAASSES